MNNQKRNTKTENATPEIKQANKRLNPIFGDNIAWWFTSN